ALAASAAAEVRVPEGARAIPGRYIVVLRDDASAPSGLRAASAAGLASDLAARHGARVTRVYQRALRGFAARMSAAAAEALSRDPAVRYVEQDSEVWAVSTQTGAVWGLD